MFDALIEHLTGCGDRIAVLTEERTLTYAELAAETAAMAAELGTDRQLVLIETRNELTTLVAYLGALAGGHVVMPLPAGGDHEAVMSTYAPDVIVRGGVVERRPGPAKRLHPDLALLLSTSGSTGSPKLVRLSRTNLDANAESIAEYLGIAQTDCAATTLPMSYCYGLSVVHSHLLRGAALLLTDRSVVDDEFWTLLRRHRGTSFAGVPHTFELLDRIGFDGAGLPDLRYVTQAGGRLPPDQVRHFAALGRQHGWQLFVMYGATEATARMAYLPAELAYDNPSCIGVPIPGGTFELVPIDDTAPSDEGELVYRGANVMMGYAKAIDDLALGRTVDALRTGDIARRHANGLYEVVARSNRFTKMYGLRIDLQYLEESLRAKGVTALCTADEQHLLVAAATRPDGCDVRGLAASVSGLPAAAIRTVDLDELPRRPSGKPDYQAVRDAFERHETAPQHVDLRAVFADVLHLDPDTIDPACSFVDLGGNSLSYVAMSVRLERALGHLPTDWQRVPLGQLEVARRPRRWWGATLETSVALRAIAIVLVAGSHAELWTLWGGAHVLLGVAGYNFGRFCLTPLPRRERVRHLRNTIAWIAVPAVVWVAFALLITDDYTPTNLLLANKFLGPHDSMTAGRLWFVEVVVWVLIVLALVCWTPPGDRWERKRPFAFAAAFLALGLAMRYDLFGFELGRDAWFTVLAFWFFAVGWAAAKSSTVWQRLAVTAVLAVGIVGYFGQPGREALVFVGLALLIWLPAIRCPSAFTFGAGLVAEASLFIYLTHYQVYPLFGDHKLYGVVAAVVVGILITQLVTLLRRLVRDRGWRALSSAAAPAGR